MFLLCNLSIFGMYPSYLQFCLNSVWLPEVNPLDDVKSKIKMFVVLKTCSFYLSVFNIPYKLSHCFPMIYMTNNENKSQISMITLFLLKCYFCWINLS